MGEAEKPNSLHLCAMACPVHLLHKLAPYFKSYRVQLILGEELVQLFTTLYPL